MTPPKASQNDLSFLEWAPGQNDPAPAKSDCSNCHASPQPAPKFSAGGASSPFFLDYTQKSNPVLDPKSSAALRAWLAQGKGPDKTAAAPAPVASPDAAAPVIPGAPGDAAQLGEQARELERLARLALDPEKKTAFYHSALAFRLLAGDAKATGAVLDALEESYEKSGHQSGKKLVAAARLWAEGKTDLALKAMADLGASLQGAPWAFHQQYAAQRSLLLQSVAAEKLRRNDYAGAKPLLLEALTLTPSDRLAARTLKLMAAHGEADLKKLAAEIESLQAQRDRLATPPVRCNVGCHSANDAKPRFDDFHDYAPLLKDAAGNPLAQGPDLSAYRSLTHLSYQEKLQLRDLDERLRETRSKYLKAREDVRVILFTKTLDDPKRELADLEASLLKDAPAFDGPDRSLPWQLAGEAHLAKQDYAKAVVALEASVREDSSRVNALFSLGNARFATGDFRGSRDAYTSVLAVQPQDVSALRFRADANAHSLAALDPKLHAGEIARVEGEIASDRALLLARCNAGEKEKIDALGKQLDLLTMGGDASPATRGETLLLLETMAKQYLALAETKQAGVPEAELVRKELNGLAAKSFGLLAKFAKADPDPAVKKRAGLYEGYGLLAEGKVDEAAKVFEPHRAEVPEIDKILGVLEKNKLRMVNLAALDAWATYNKEGARIQGEAQDGILGDAIGGIESWFRDDDKDFRDDTRARWQGQVAFVAELRSRVESGKADTILQAMAQIEKDGPESMKADARYYLNYGDRVVTGFPLGALVHLVDKLPPEPGEAETLLRKTWDLERQNPAIEAPYAFYTLVHFLDKEANYNGTAREHMDALEGHGSFGRSAFKFITSMSPESLAVDVLLMFGSAGLGNLAKLAALSRLEKAGVTGYKAIVLAGAAGVAVEGTALWAANLGKEALLKDPSKVFTQEHMLKSYGATLIMIGGLKGAGALGESVAPRAAKSLGLIAEGGTKLTSGGKLLAWGIGHGAGLGGMIATSHINQGLGLTPKPVGGWKEGLVHDVFGYVQFAVAHKMADRVFGGKLSAISGKQHTEIAVREAILTAKSHADALGFRAVKNAKGEIVESPERKLLIGLLVDSSLNRPGFSGGKLAKLVESRQFGKANEYLAEFGLPLEYSKSGQLSAAARGEASPHAAAGIPAGKAKPPPKPAEIDAALRAMGERAARWLDKALEWMFGPPGDGGGFGGLQPAFAGAYGMVAPKADPKGPPAVYMSGKNTGEGKGGKKTGGKGPVKIENPAAVKAANDNPKYEVVPYTLKDGENFDAALGGLREHFGDPTKIIVIQATRPIDKPETIEARLGYHDPAARIEVHLPDGSVKVFTGKSRIDQLHPDLLNDGKECLWEAGTRDVRELFTVQGKNGTISLQKPDGVTRIEIHSQKPLAKDDLAFLLGEANRLGVEIVVEGDRKLTFRQGKDRLELSCDKKIGAEELDKLIEHAVSSGQDIAIASESGNLLVQKGSSVKDTHVTTAEPAAALLAPEKITLELGKAPTAEELKSLQAQGLRKVRFQDDPTAPEWLPFAVAAMRASQGLHVRAVDAKGKVLWENVARPEGDVLKTQDGLFQPLVEAHAKSAGWKDRLAELKKMFGPEGTRLDFAPAAYRWAAAHDLSDASVPPGGKAPAISPEQFQTWLQRGMSLAAFKHGKAAEKGKAELAKELQPFAEGFKAEASGDGWSQAVGKMKEFLGKDSRNPALLAKVFENLRRDPVASDAFENNAYDLAKFFREAENPHGRLKDLNAVYAEGTGQIQLKGSLFGTYLKIGDLGAKREQDTLKMLLTDAKSLAAKGDQVVIEAIPTSKHLSGTTPDFAMTVSSGGAQAKFFLEVKKVSGMTVDKGTKESFAAELEATFNHPGKKADDASLGTQLGKGLAQLHSYAAKGPSDTLILDVHLDKAPPPYFRESLQRFLGRHCPNVVVQVQYKEIQTFATVAGGRTESRQVEVRTLIRADSASKYASYDSNANYFAPLMPDVAAAE